jgi:hypothetical protein
LRDRDRLVKTTSIVDTQLNPTKLELIHNSVDRHFCQCPNKKIEKLDVLLSFFSLGDAFYSEKTSELGHHYRQSSAGLCESRLGK